MEGCQIAFPTGARAAECQMKSAPVLFYLPPRKIEYDIHIYKVKMDAWSQHFWDFFFFTGLNDESEAGSGLLTEPPLAQMSQCWIYSMLLSCHLLG